MAQSIRAGHLVKPKAVSLIFGKTLDLGMDFFRWKFKMSMDAGKTYIL